jgi:hypothetical protein
MSVVQSIELVGEREYRIVIKTPSGRQDIVLRVEHAADVGIDYIPSSAALDQLMDGNAGLAQPLFAAVMAFHNAQRTPFPFLKRS